MQKSKLLVRDPDSWPAWLHELAGRTSQFGLVAEEVAQVFPDFIVNSKVGRS